jgi:hypothetical protein
MVRGDEFFSTQPWRLNYNLQPSLGPHQLKESLAMLDEQPVFLNDSWRMVLICRCIPIYPIQRFGTIGITFGTICPSNKKPLLRTVTAFCLEARPRVELG